MSRPHAVSRAFSSARPPAVGRRWPPGTPPCVPSPGSWAPAAPSPLPVPGPFLPLTGPRVRPLVAACGFRPTSRPAQTRFWRREARRGSGAWLWFSLRWSQSWGILVACADRWPGGEALRRHRLWSRRQECARLALWPWEGPRCRHARTRVVWRCLRGRHPQQRCLTRGGNRLPLPPAPQRTAAGRTPLEGRLGAVRRWKYSAGEPRGRGTLLLWAPSPAILHPPSGFSCGNHC